MFPTFRVLPLLCCALLACRTVGAADGELRIMSFNAWGIGANEGRTPAATVAAIRAANPDLIGLQESRSEASVCTEQDCPADGASRAPALAAALGYALLEQTVASPALWANAILSRHPIIGPTPGGLGARIKVHGRRVVLLNIHATDYPYQPYQLLGIPYGAAPLLADAAAAEAAAHEARGDALELLLAEIAAAGDAELIAITGDFNEPSHRDWTAAAVAAGLHPLPVRWPFSRALEAAGFVDTFRAVHADPVARPGFTWSPTIGADASGDHRDRIDFVYARAAVLEVRSASVVGEPGPFSDLAVAPWPSDHRAVVARIRF